MPIAPIPTKDEAQPRYVQIRRILESRIVDGTYPIGTFLPAELDLAAEFTISRTTIREAFRYLTERGYVERRQGVGTRVISDRSHSSFFQNFGSLEELFQVAVETYYVVMETKTVTLDAETAELVGGLAGEDWILVNGVRWTEAGGKPLCYVQSYVPMRFSHLVDRFPGHQGPFFELLERHSDRPIQEAVQEIRAVPMPEPFIRQLGLRPGAWSLQLLRRYVTEAGVLIASFNWHPADQMTYVMHIHRSRKGDAES